MVLCERFVQSLDKSLLALAITFQSIQKGLESGGMLCAHLEGEAKKAGKTFSTLCSIRKGCGMERNEAK